MLFKLAGLGLKKTARTAPPAPEPTELALGKAADAAFDALPAEHRKRLGEVREVIRRLQADAHALRGREAELDQAMSEAGAEKVLRDKRRLEELRAAPGKKLEAALLDRRIGAVADLEAARQKARDRLASAVATLENIRIDLLRLRAGVGTPDELTADLEVALEIGREIDAELAGRREAASLLAEPTGSG